MKTLEKMSKKDLNLLLNSIECLEQTIVCLTAGERFKNSFKWYEEMEETNPELLKLYDVADSVRAIAWKNARPKRLS